MTLPQRPSLGGGMEGRASCLLNLQAFCSLLEYERAERGYSTWLGVPVLILKRARLLQGRPWVHGRRLGGSAGSPLGARRSSRRAGR